MSPDYIFQPITVENFGALSLDFLREIGALEVDSVASLEKSERLAFFFNACLSQYYAFI